MDSRSARVRASIRGVVVAAIAGVMLAGCGYSSQRDTAEEYRELREVKASGQMFAEPAPGVREGYIPEGR